MQPLRVLVKNIRLTLTTQVLLPFRTGINKKWNSFKRYPLDSFVSVFSWLALLEIVILFSWLIIQIGRINKQNVVTEYLEKQTIRIHIHYPLYVGQDEEGKIGIDVENIGQRNIQEISIYIRENNGDYFWFPQGNYSKFNNLQVDTSQYAELSYIVGNSIPKNAKLLYLTATASYRFFDDNSGQLGESKLMPLNRVQFSDSPQLRIDDLKGELEASGKGLSESFLGLSSTENIIGFLVAISASIIALRGNLFEIFGIKKS